MNRQPKVELLTCIDDNSKIALLEQARKNIEAARQYAKTTISTDVLFLNALDTAEASIALVKQAIQQDKEREEQQLEIQADLWATNDSNH